MFVVVVAAALVGDVWFASACSVYMVCQSQWGLWPWASDFGFT